MLYKKTYENLLNYLTTATANPSSRKYRKVFLTNELEQMSLSQSMSH